MTPIVGVPDVLERARSIAHPAMVAAVDTLAPDIAHMVRYHLGWTDVDGTPTSSTGGKGIRQALAVLSAQAAWADAEVGVPGGVAVELVHNFSLVHDDVIDGDVERRHRPTVWALWGVGSAIIVGDAMETLAHQVLLKEPTGATASAALAAATAEMITGQANDLAFERRHTVSVEECTSMSMAKTGALLGCATSIGAILAGAEEATVGALRDFGRHLGLAFQAVDDLLGIWGNPSTTGKAAGNDLRQRKKSMPVVAALAAGGEESEELRKLLFDDIEQVLPYSISLDGSGTTPANSPAPRPLGPDEVEHATRLVEACGGREWTALRAKAHLDAALASLERVRLSAIPHRELADVAVYVVERES